MKLDPSALEGDQLIQDGVGDGEAAAEVPPEEPQINGDQQALLDQVIETLQGAGDKLKLSEDFYAITYVSYMLENQAKYSLTKDAIHQNFTNSLYIFGFQTVLSFLVGLQFFSQDFSFTLGDFPIFITRYVCAILLHLQLLNEIKQSLDMQKYLANHTEQFSSRLAPYLIALMQLFGALFTEVINLCLICGQSSIMDVIINFIALGAISQIDDFYANSLSYCPVKEALENPIVVKNRSRDISFRDRNAKSKAIRLLYRFFRILYASAYFYFMPFITLIFTYLVGGTADQPEA
ncbi:hypothetical protein FGO68_gene10053 [Halteria grandinella]|uniref:Uncharacterized protein n=1 Tax=Halteria grandinella TaxID=5974 RepID=A0A8J8SVK8_HALGN|nr:hypothetical protein FGO68_gene10053 [Halteria grandinella]